MSGSLVKFRKLGLCLGLTALFLLSACSQSNSGYMLTYAPAPTGATDASSQTAPPQILEGRVVGVADGDTITVLDAGDRQTRIRLQGIDAPESSQAFGQASKRNLSELVFNRQVIVEYEKTDRYGRTLGKVLADGRDVNLEQVRAGLAWHYKYYQNEQSPADRRLYADMEVEARSAGRGLWADPSPIPPWDYRRGRRGAAEEGGGDRTAPPASSRPAGGQTEEATVPEAETVYITRTGTKYHRLSCRYLRRSRIPISLKDAKRSYEPCSVCRPPR